MCQLDCIRVAGAQLYANRVLHDTARGQSSRAVAAATPSTTPSQNLQQANGASMSQPARTASGSHPWGRTHLPGTAGAAAAAAGSEGRTCSAWPLQRPPGRACCTQQPPPPACAAPTALGGPSGPSAASPAGPSAWSAGGAPAGRKKTCEVYKSNGVPGRLKAGSGCFLGV